MIYLKVMSYTQGFRCFDSFESVLKEKTAYSLSATDVQEKCYLLYLTGLSLAALSYVSR